MWDRGDAGDGSASDPGVPAQMVSVREQIQSAVQRAEAFEKQVKLPQAAANMSRPWTWPGNTSAPRI